MSSALPYKVKTRIKFRRLNMNSVYGPAYREAVLAYISYLHEYGHSWSSAQYLASTEFNVSQRRVARWRKGSRR